MKRLHQNDDQPLPSESVKSVVVEFSNSPANPDWAPSTPSQSSVTKTSDPPAHVLAIIASRESHGSAPATIANRYVIMRQLGAGGQASVFLAEDMTLAREVAIKMPRLGSTLSQEQQEAFRREARSIAALRHAGIVTVHDFGIHEDGRCFIVLEHLPGRSLNDYLRSGAAEKAGYRRSTELIRRVAEALHYAHQRGIFHRDLKPGNILLDEQENPRISDFGLAVTQETQRDLEGEVAGTAPYMSPEQVRGEAHWLNGQADIWALGVVLYELLTGQRPFQGASNQEIYSEILEGNPVPPRQLDDRIPPDLDEIVMKCLEKDPAKRYRSAQDVAARLGEVRFPEQPASPKSKWRFRAAAGLIAAAVLTLLTAFLFISIPREKPRQLVPGVWNDVLEQSPEALVWTAGAENGDWKWHAREQRVSLAGRRLGLLQVADVPFDNFDLECQIRQSRWQGSGGIGVFLGYRGETIMKMECKSTQVLAVESIGSSRAPQFSLDRRSMFWPVGQDQNSSNHSLAEEEIHPKDLEWLTLLVRVRERKISNVSVNRQPALRLTSDDARQMELVMEQGREQALECRGPVGLYIDGRGNGVSGEFRFVRIKPNP